MTGGGRRIRRYAATLARGAAIAPAVLACGVVDAQVTPAPAPAPVPQQQLPTRQQVEPPAAPTPPRATAQVDSRGALPAEACPLATSPLRTTITQIRYVAAGRDAVPPEVLRALAKVTTPAGEQPLAVICSIRDAANAALGRSGFVASAQVPPQQITDGTLTLSIVLARIVEVRVRGEADRYRSLLALAIERLRGLDPLNERDAERLLLLAGDVPGLDVQLALRPAGSAPGDVIGDLTVVTRRSTVLANVQNYGSRALGPQVGYARVDLNAVLVAGDSLYLGGSLTAQPREQQVIQAGYRATLDAAGLSAGPRLTMAWSRPDIGTLDLRSRSIIAGFEIARPLVRTVRNNLSAAAGVEAIEQRVRIFDPTGSSPLNLDRLRVAYVRVDASTSARGSDGQDAYALATTMELRKGFDILGATQRGTITANGYGPSRFEGDAAATIMRVNLSALGRIGPWFSVAHNVVTQWADRPLLNFDEQAIGNLTIGFGYSPGANTADRFVGSHSEARVDLPPLAGLSFQPFAFADNAWLWNLDSFSTENGRHLRSVGGGLRARVPGLMLLEAIYARPLDRALSIDRNRPPARLLGSITLQFSPPLR